MRTAERHAVLPLIYLSLNNACLDSIPKEVHFQLQEKFKKIALNNLAMARELLRILAVFKEHNLDAISFKGPTLTLRLYGDISRRQFGDLDILIRIKDMQKALELLQAEGYQLDYYLNEKQSAAFLKFAHHHHFSNPNTGITVEIHWRISDSIYPSQLDLDKLWNRAEVVTVYGKEVLSFSAIDTLQVLCEHGARHNWDRLSWICDIALLTKVKDLDWPGIFNQADISKNEHQILLGLSLANSLFSTPLPLEVSKRIDSYPDLPALESKAIEGLFLERDLLENTPTNGIQGGMDKMLFFLKASDRFPDRASLYLQMAIFPTLADFAWIKLPNWMHPFYYLVRPIRLIYIYQIALLKWILKRD